MLEGFRHAAQDRCTSDVETCAAERSIGSRHASTLRLVQSRVGCNVHHRITAVRRLIAMTNKFSATKNVAIATT